MFFDIFALLALIFFKDTKKLSSIYITCWYLHNSNTIGSNVFQLNLLFFSKLKYNNLIVKIIIRHVYRDCVFLILLLVCFFDFTLSILFARMIHIFLRYIFCGVCSDPFIQEHSTVEISEYLSLFCSHKGRR